MPMSYFYDWDEEDSFTLTKTEAILFDLIYELECQGLTLERCEEMAKIVNYFYDQTPHMLEEELEIFWEFRCLFLQERRRLYYGGPGGNDAA